MADKYEYTDKAMSPVFRTAFVRLFDNPQVDDKDPNRKTWSVNAILKDPADKKPFQKLFNDAAKKMWGDKAGTMVKHKSFGNPFKDGGEMMDREGNLYAGFEEGQVCLKLNTSQGAPGVVDRSNRKIVDKNGATVTDKESGAQEEIEANAVYSGCWMRATFTAQAYDRSDGFGISFKLENLQKIRDDEKLGGGGRAKAEDDFEPIDDLGDFDDSEEEDLLA